MKSIDFDSVKPPTQEQFNEYHSEPIDYGEDGDQLLGFQYTKEEAIEKFKERWIRDCGDDSDFRDDLVVMETSAGWSVNPDKYEDGDFTFVWIRGDGETKARYDAWLLWV